MSLRSLETSHLIGVSLNQVAGVVARCQTAKELEERGEYEAARGVIGDYWRRVGDSPVVGGLTELEAAHLLLRASSLTRWLGSSYQIPNSMEIAKNLATQSAEIFIKLNQNLQVAEAYTNMAAFYLREGAYDESRISLQAALSYANNPKSEEFAFAQIVGSQVEIRSGRFQDALSHLAYIEEYCRESENPNIKAAYHHNLALIYKNLGQYDKALIEYPMASAYHKKAGHLPHYARAENNLGFVFYLAGNTSEAHRHLLIARHIFSKLKDQSGVAQVNDTRARVYLSEGRHKEAATAALESLRRLKDGGEYSFIVEAKITYATALARMDKADLALAELRMAIEIATLAGDRDGAGLAWLVMMEEVPVLDDTQKREAFIEADTLLDKSQDAGLISRLRTVARTMVMEQVKKKSHAISLGAGFCLTETLTNLEISLIEEALKKSGGNVSKAAGLLGIPRQNLEWKIDRQYRGKVNFSRKNKRLRSIVKQKPAEVIPISCYRPDLAQSKKCLCVRVTDDSLKRLGPRAGDVLAIEIGMPNEGDLIALHTKTNLYVIGFYCLKNGRIFLESDDPTFETFTFEEAEVAIDGKVVGYFKQGEAEKIYPLLNVR